MVDDRTIREAEKRLNRGGDGFRYRVARSSRGMLRVTLFESQGKRLQLAVYSFEVDLSRHAGIEEIVRKAHNGFDYYMALPPRELYRESRYHEPHSIEELGVTE